MNRNNINKQDILLIGGGGHCLSCIDVVEQGGQYRIAGIVDLPEKLGSRVLGYPVVGNDDDIARLAKDCPNFLISLGQIRSAAGRQRIYERVKQAGGNLPVVVSPHAYVSSRAQLAEGSIVMHQALVNSGARIGLCCIINSKALVEHEARIGAFCHISTAACINGQVSIGEHCFVGSNTVVGNNLDITDHCVLAAGSQVLKNISLPGVYLGQPLRKIE
ncbi:MAG TPA: acetyltransferase [Bacteroidales bacterium]|jgi:sugar O-acyltransferase (sialic acid O-acetyltransferase NeuD family)|nr:MAG: UDP-N-acetylbacillosamine N-acetyltransferase [Candidatus Hydrogenedentes bacterium ADurb.Bin170]HPB36048.1 acetyltransferase [Bacteroidales bacterium]HPY58562.1 acetyltransferase [Bacteroidales bacterium]HQB71032.1 acetyltransferase [Bacteroidales bacterium]